MKLAFYCDLNLTNICWIAFSFRGSCYGHTFNLFVSFLDGSVLSCRKLLKLDQSWTSRGTMSVFQILKLLRTYASVVPVLVFVLGLLWYMDRGLARFPLFKLSSFVVLMIYLTVLGVFMEDVVELTFILHLHLILEIVRLVSALLSLLLFA